jgi:hypothetical protein
MKTLAQMAAAIADDVGRAGDTETITKAKAYLEDRLGYVWDIAPWKDSLAIISISKDPTATDAPGHILYLPANCDVALGVRTAAQGQINPFSLEKMLIGVPEKFTATGTPYEFAQLSPAVWTARAAIGVDLQARRGSTQPEAEVTVLYTDVNGDQATYTFTPATTMTAAHPSGTAFVASVDAVWQNGTTTFTFSDDTPTDLFSGSSFTPKVRLALASVPTATTTYTVLFKRKCPTWTADYQEPPLRGSDRLLQTLAHADILEWIRKPAKAQAKAAEGMAMLDELRDKEVYQEATIRTLIPDCGPDPRELVSGGFQASKGFF